MTDLKTSLLVNRQVPEFVRDEHPKFISFLEAYYEFLETKQGTEKNDLTTEAKKLRYLSDIDSSLDEFQSNFFNTYAALVPQSSDISKEFLIKNILPLYLSKGSESSFKFLFRLLFGDEVTISYPKDKVLRASDGKWNVKNVLRISSTIKTIFEGDGTSKEFLLAQEVNSNEIDVYVNDVLTTDYFIRKESKKVIFNTAPADGASVKIEYSNFNTNLLTNRKVTGRVSGAVAIVENISIKTISGQSYFDFFINTKTLVGSFQNGEIVDTDFIDSLGNLIDVELDALADIKSINIIDGGASYNIGDPVIIRGPATRTAVAVVSKVATGEIANLEVIQGGHGFQSGAIIEAIGISRDTFNAFVSSVDTSGNVSANSITVYNDVISPYANTVLNVANYNFPATNIAAGENVNTIIAQALSTLTITNLGPILNAELSITAALSNPQFQAFPPTVNSTDANNIVYLDSLGIIAKIDIVDGGQGYVANDVIAFERSPYDYMGRGANAIVSNVTASGTITGVKIISGGLGYDSAQFPTLNVVSSNAQAHGAVLTVSGILGDGEKIQAILDQYELGQILSIKILDAGAGYVTIPAVDLSKFGDGTATANAQLQDSYLTLTGKWDTTDSIISSDDRRLQGRNYYLDYSYILSSQVEFEKYKSIFKQLIHPAGYINFAEYQIRKDIDIPNETSTSLITTKTISGSVNVNSSIYVTGTNTKFLVSQTNGVLTAGTKIAVNSQVRIVDTILSNTSLKVTSAFTITSNNESVSILA